MRLRYFLFDFDRFKIYPTMVLEFSELKEWCVRTRESRPQQHSRRKAHLRPPLLCCAHPCSLGTVRRRYVQGRFKPYFEDSPHALYTVRTHRSYTGGASECVRACV